MKAGSKIEFKAKNGDIIAARILEIDGNEDAMVWVAEIANPDADHMISRKQIVS